MQKKRANLDSLDNVFKDLSEPWVTDHYISLFDELKQPSFSWALLFASDVNILSLNIFKGKASLQLLL